MIPLSKTLIRLLFFWLCLYCHTAAASSQAGSAKLTQDQLKQLQQQISSFQQELKTINQSKHSEQQKLQLIDQSINQLVQQIHQLDTKITTLEQKSKQLDGEIISNSERLKQQKQVLSEQLTSSYQLGQQEFIKLLLNQQDPAFFSRMMTYYQYLNQARLAQIKKVEQLNRTLLQQKSDYNLLQQEIELQQYLKKNEKLELEQQQRERTQVLQQLSVKETDIQNDLKLLQKNEKQLQQLLLQLQQASKLLQTAKPGKPFKNLKRKLYWPLRGKLKKLYGNWRSLNKVKWQGHIIQAPEGRDVYSIAYGTVVYADWLRGYGFLTIIDHGGNYMSLYGYSQALLTEVGDRVAQGQVIAKAGRTSGRSKAGIYFEIRYKGKPVNPSKWCRKMPPN